MDFLFEPEFWSIAGTAGEEFADEEERRVNQNDPFAAIREQFSPYEQDMDSVGQYEEDLKLKEAFEAVEENGAEELLMAAAAMDRLDMSDDDFDDEIERISLKEANRPPKKLSKQMVGPEPLRPFEQWVQDVLNGKKTLDDDL